MNMNASMPIGKKMNPSGVNKMSTANPISIEQIAPARAIFQPFFLDALTAPPTLSKNNMSIDFFGWRGYNERDSS